MQERINENIRQITHDIEAYGDNYPVLVRYNNHVFVDYDLSMENRLSDEEQCREMTLGSLLEEIKSTPHSGE